MLQCKLVVDVDFVVELCMGMQISVCCWSCDVLATHGICLFVFVHRFSTSWISALLLQHLQRIILKQMWRAKCLRRCAPVAASAGLTIGNATPIRCIGNEEPKRIEAKIYADWRHTFP